MIHLRNFGPEAYRLVTTAQEFVTARNRKLATTGDLLIAILDAPKNDSAAFLREFRVDVSSKPVIESQIILADYITPPTSGMYAMELAQTLYAASAIPGRFGSTHANDLHLLAGMFCEMNPHTKSIYRITSEKRVALEALIFLGIDIVQFRDRLFARLLPKPVPRPLILF